LLEQEVNESDVGLATSGPGRYLVLGGEALDQFGCWLVGRFLRDEFAAKGLGEEGQITRTGHAPVSGGSLHPACGNVTRFQSASPLSSSRSHVICPHPVDKSGQKFGMAGKMTGRCSANVQPALHKIHDTLLRRALASGIARQDVGDSATFSITMQRKSHGNIQHDHVQTRFR
jgi:hypothetical protein